jgi:hypothetical protein
MAQPIDVTALFLESRSRASEYPRCLIRTEAFIHSLDSYYERLGGERLFHAKERNVFLWDLVGNPTSMYHCAHLKHQLPPQPFVNVCTVVFRPSPKLDTLDDLYGLLKESEPDPRWRFAYAPDSYAPMLHMLTKYKYSFIQSLSHRDPLSCSREQLVLLLTHYQVMPSFLDFVFTFKSRADRSGPLSHATFRHENYLELNHPPLSLPGLGRSGVQIQHAFNFLSVEKSTLQGELDKWPLRHMSLYHSFDVKTGQAFWIVLKGNRLMRKRIAKAAESNRHLQASSITTPERSFVASLQVHLIVMEWCVENWSEYIDDLEDKIGDNVVQAKVAPVAEATSPLPLATSFSRRETMRTTVSRFSTFYSGGSQDTSQPTSPTSPPSQPQIRSFSDLLRRGTRLANQQGSVPEDVEAVQGGSSLEELDASFSFDKLQRLSLLGDGLDRSLLVIEQNQKVMTEIREQYNEVITSHGFMSNMNVDLCKGELSIFFRRVRSIERDLEIYFCRLKALTRALDNDMHMVGTSSYLQNKLPVEVRVILRG